MFNSRIIKKITVILLALVMAMTCLAGCGGTSDKETLSDSGQKPGTIVAEDEATLTIVDQAGREVQVKKNPESIALCYRVIVRFLIALDQGEKIKGMGKSEPFLEEIQPSLKDCADVGKGVADIEALAELKPDLFFHKASDLETLEAVEKIGIPAVGIQAESAEDITLALDIMGKVCGAEEKASQLIEWYDSHIAKASELTSGLETKKTAIVMGSSIGKVADGSMLQGYMLTRAGAENCADELKATELWPTAGAEQILKWNPEYIFITNSEGAMYSPEDIYKDKAWSQVSAVKNKNVYLMPAEGDSWEFPGPVSALGIEYMISTMYPDLLSNEELDKDVKEFYELSYGRTFTREELGY